MPVPAGIAAAAIGAQVLGGLFGGVSRNRAEKAAIRENRRQFDTTAAFRRRELELEEEKRRQRQQGLARTGSIRERILAQVLGPQSGLMAR